MLVEFNCNQRARWSGATATNIPVGSKQRKTHGYCNMPASLVKLLLTYLLGVRHVSGPVPYNQTCATVNMSVDPVAMMPGLLVGRK